MICSFESRMKFEEAGFLTNTITTHIARNRVELLDKFRVSNETKPWNFVASTDYKDIKTLM